MNNYYLSQLKIDILRTQLIGNNYSIFAENKKGEELEKAFNYLIIQPENGGAKINNIENNKSLFNYSKIPRPFEVAMVGLVSLEEYDGESTDIKSQKMDEEKKCYNCKLREYDFYNIGTVKFKHNNITIRYNIKDMKYIEGKNNISADFCEHLKDYAKCSSVKSKSNIFKKAELAIEKDKEKFEKELKQKKFTKENYVSYLEKIISFSDFIKDNFNGAQLGHPNIIKFAQIENVDKTSIFFFHLILKREIDSAVKVLDDYDFIKYSNMEEVEICHSQNIFKKNDILLFEIKDTATEFQGLQCINYNYKVMNGFVKTLKQEEEFKNCEFYYILIQENKKEKGVNLYADLIKEIKTKTRKSILQVKFYLFDETNLFNRNIREMGPDKIRTLYLLKDELLFFRNKFDEIDKKFDKLFYLQFAIIIAVLIILIFK